MCDASWTGWCESGARAGRELRRPAIAARTQRRLCSAVVKRGLPRQLAERDRRTLARYFGVDETLLGAEPGVGVQTDANTVRVPRLSVQVSAGPGAEVEGEFAICAFWFDHN